MAKPSNSRNAAAALGLLSPSTKSNKPAQKPARHAADELRGKPAGLVETGLADAGSLTESGEEKDSELAPEGLSEEKLKDDDEKKQKNPKHRNRDRKPQRAEPSGDKDQTSYYKLAAQVEQAKADANESDGAQKLQAPVVATGDASSSVVDSHLSSTQAEGVAASASTESNRAEPELGASRESAAAQAATHSLTEGGMDSPVSLNFEPVREQAEITVTRVAPLDSVETESGTRAHGVAEAIVAAGEPTTDPVKPTGVESVLAIVGHPEAAAEVVSSIRIQEQQGPDSVAMAIREEAAASTTGALGVSDAAVLEPGRSSAISDSLSIAEPTITVPAENSVSKLEGNAAEATNAQVASTPATETSTLVEAGPSAERLAPITSVSEAVEQGSPQPPTDSSVHEKPASEVASIAITTAVAERDAADSSGTVSHSHSSEQPMAAHGSHAQQASEQPKETPTHHSEAHSHSDGAVPVHADQKAESRAASNVPEAHSQPAQAPHELEHNPHQQPHRGEHPLARENGRRTNPSTDDLTAGLLAPAKPRHGDTARGSTHQRTTPVVPKIPGRADKISADPTLGLISRKVDAHSKGSSAAAPVQPPVQMREKSRAGLGDLTTSAPKVPKELFTPFKTPTPPRASKEGVPPSIEASLPQQSPKESIGQAHPLPPIVQREPAERAGPVVTPETVMTSRESKPHGSQNGLATSTGPRDKFELQAPAHPGYGFAPTSAVPAALMDHLTTHGVPKEEAQMTIAAISAGLHHALESGAQSEGAKLTFHPQGEVAVSIEPAQPAAPVSSKAISVEMDTLKEIHREGMPREGVEGVKSNLGSEASNMSQLDVVNNFGHDVVSAVGREGYPKENVQEMKTLLQGHAKQAGIAPNVITNGKALQALGTVARDGKQSTVSISDRGNPNKTTSVAVKDLRKSMGWSNEKTAVKPARDNQNQAERTRART